MSTESPAILLFANFINESDVVIVEVLTEVVTPLTTKLPVIVTSPAKVPPVLALL